MAEFRDQSELKLAMNGRMTVMTGGLIMAFSSLSSTLMYGINLFTVASGASKGNEEYVSMLSEYGIALNIVYIAAVCFLVLAAAEIYTGITCLLRCNRLDKAQSTRKLIIGLLVLEIVIQIFLAVIRMMNVSTLFLSIAVPLYMLWGVSKLCKLAKLYPDRKTALNTQKRQAPSQKKNAAPAAPAPKKSLHDRAMMTQTASADDDIVEEAESTAENESAGTADASENEENSGSEADSTTHTSSDSPEVSDDQTDSGEEPHKEQSPQNC